MTLMSIKNRKTTFLRKMPLHALVLQFPLFKKRDSKLYLQRFLLFFHQSTVSFLFWEHQSERDYQRRNVALNKVTVTPACFCRSYLGPVSPQESGRVAD